MKYLTLLTAPFLALALVSPAGSQPSPPVEV